MRVFNLFRPFQPSPAGPRAFAWMQFVSFLLFFTTAECGYLIAAEKVLGDGPKPPADKDNAEPALYDFAANINKEIVPARTDAQMKEFLDKRLEELNSSIGGTWRMIETKHFYCFSNIPEAKHRMIANVWNETDFYATLARVLMHKEGDKLWNNKCPTYYFDKYGQFQKFAAVIDKNPGAGRSGGYFSSRGRDVHICIPFYSERKHGVDLDTQAHNTVIHEGTHAFLQLTGEDVRLSRWLQEGLAQFMEFYCYKIHTNDKYDGERERRISLLKRDITADTVPTWSEMKERPAGGTDIAGYAYAWSKLEFLYNNSNKTNLPGMIKKIKSGMSEDEAMASQFGQPVSKLESVYLNWMKSMCKQNFKF